MYSKILIANRGAIARRIVRACHDLSIGSAVVFTEPDQGAPYLSEAGEAHLIAGRSPLDSYMNTEQLLKVAKEKNIHPYNHIFLVCIYFYQVYLLFLLT